MIIETGATQALVIEFEPQWLDQMQAKAGIGAQSDQVSGIRRNLGLEQNDIKHGVSAVRCGGMQAGPMMGPAILAAERPSEAQAYADLGAAIQGTAATVGVEVGIQLTQPKIAIHIGSKGVAGT